VPETAKVVGLTMSKRINSLYLERRACETQIRKFAHRPRPTLCFRLVGLGLQHSYSSAISIYKFSRAADNGLDIIMKTNEASRLSSVPKKSATL